MRLSCSAVVALAVLASFASRNAQADCGDRPADASAYGHKHKVYNFNGEPPEWSQDTLFVWTSAQGEQCFSLETSGINGHECGAKGKLEAAGPRRLRFNADVCSIEIKSVGRSLALSAGKGWARSGAGGNCPKRFGCGMYGSVESGTFSP